MQYLFFLSHGVTFEQDAAWYPLLNWLRSNVQEDVVE